jgi:hypothetical protein
MDLSDGTTSGNTDCAFGPPKPGVLDDTCAMGVVSHPKAAAVAGAARAATTDRAIRLPLITFPRALALLRSTRSRGNVAGMSLMLRNYRERFYARSA